MAKREISSTLRNLKFMQRAVKREEKTKKQEEEVKTDGNFSSPGSIKKCVVLMEGDPHPGAVIGRMSFQSFNPYVDKLKGETTNFSTNVGGQNGRTSFREKESSLDGAECSNIDKAKSDVDLKRKQPEGGQQSSQNNKKSPKTEDGQQSSPYSSKGSFKQPKHEKLDWNVLIPKSQNKRSKRGF